MDGEITIGTTLSTDKFDRQITQLEKKMQKEEDKKIVIGAKLTSQEQELDNARKKTDDLAEAYQRLKAAQDALESGHATPGQFETFQDLQGTYGSLEQLGASFDKALTKQDAIEQKVNTTKLRYNEIVSKVDEYNQKIQSVKLEKQVSEANRLKESFNNVGSSIQKSIRNVARLALGIFGVRSAYLTLRRASSDLASYDKQYAANLEYIRYALTQAIAPVLQWIVRLAATLLGYINAILQAWFGINLFSRGSAESFNKMKAGASGASKAVKEIKKQLSGFDEINMLTDQSDTGTKAGGGGVTAPDFDLSSLQGDKPAWLQWIIDNKELILGALAGIAAGLIALKLGLGGLMSLGIGLAVAGIVALIQDIIKFIKNPSWNNFANILRDLAILLAGVAVAMIAFKSTNPVGWIMLAISAIIAVTSAIVKYWDEIKKTLFTVGTWINQNVIQPIVKFFKNMWTNIKSVFEPVGNWFRDKFKNAYEKIKSVFSGIKGFMQGIWNTIKSVFTGIGQKIGDAVGGAFRSAVNAVMTIMENILNTPIRAINGLISVINAIPGINLGHLSTFSLPRLAVGGIVNMPNKGTMIGGAIAGESGREGVLPLTDQQAMAELGAEIGKHVLVNLTNITQMNGRIIGRELKQIQSEQDFAFNN